MIEQTLKIKEKQALKKINIMFINMLKKSNEEIENEIKNESVDNQFIKIEEKTKVVEEENKENLEMNFSFERKKEIIISKVENLCYTVEKKDIIIYIVSKINSYGILEDSDIFLCEEISSFFHIVFSQKELKEFLECITSLNGGSPVFRSFKDFLFFNINETFGFLPFTSDLLDSFFPVFSSRLFLKTIKLFHSYNKEIKLCVSFIFKILSLSKKNEINFKCSSPDFFVSLTSNFSFKIELNNCCVPSLYKPKCLEESDSSLSLEDLEYIKKKYIYAKNLIRMLERRRDCLFSTMKEIVNLQSKFFSSGDFKDLFPMKLEDVAKRVNLSISTVSRIVSNKFVQTDFGIFKLKDVFSLGIKQTNGFSSIYIQERIKEIIMESEKALSDNKIRILLASEGINISRRTVNKYRKGLFFFNSYIIGVLKKYDIALN